MTSRENAEHVVAGDAEQLRLLIARVQEYAIFQLDPFGRIVSWNAGAERLKGYRAEEVLGKHFSVFFDPVDVQTGLPQRNLADAARKGESMDEGWRIRKDGSRFWASAVLTALRDSAGELRGFVKITRDLTRRHEQEVALEQTKEKLELHMEQRAAALVKMNLELRQEIAERQRVEGELRTSLEQLRALAARLQLVREEERARVARELHDELGQACTAIKMDLASIGRRTSDTEVQLRSKVDSALQLADKMIFTVRRIASELRPGTLDDLGLIAALEWQAQEFATRTGIGCVVALPREKLSLDSERSTAIFRIFQESLTNVARHAQATSVHAHLEKQGDYLILQIHDNGKGFDVGRADARKTLGLVGMRERAHLLNGELKIEGAPGGGTTVTLRIPLATGGPAQNGST